MGQYQRALSEWYQHTPFRWGNISVHSWSDTNIHLIMDWHQRTPYWKWYKHAFYVGWCRHALLEWYQRTPYYGVTSSYTRLEWYKHALYVGWYQRAFLGVVPACASLWSDISIHPIGVIQVCNFFLCGVILACILGAVPKTLFLFHPFFFNWSYHSLPPHPCRMTFL